MMILFRPTLPQGTGQFMNMLRFGFLVEGTTSAPPVSTVTEFLIKWRRRGRR